MRRTEACGAALIEVLMVLSVLTVLLSVLLPAGFSLYARAAVEYEAMRLVAELRRVQAVTRMTTPPLYMMQGRAAWEREPRVRIRAGSYAVHHPFAGEDRVHKPLPRVRIVQETMRETPVVFGRNGEIAGRWSHNMKIRVYAEGCDECALYVVIDRAARIRLQRGGQDAPDETD